MRLSKVIERLYLKVFVGIVISGESLRVAVAMVKGEKVIAEYEKQFEGKEVGKEVAAFIAPYLSETPFYYTAALNTAAQQGALPTCSSSEAQNYLDLSTSLTLCHDNGWMVYSAKPEVDALKQKCGRVGLDFIFPPYFLLERVFADKVNGAGTLYVLIQQTQLSIAVFENDKLLYGQHFVVEAEKPMPEEAHVSFDLDGDALEEGIHLDDIDALDDLEGLDDLGDIEDLDAIEEIDEFADEVAEFEAIGAVEEEKASFDTFGIDYKRFEKIQLALQNFYGDERYEKMFIESVYVADCCTFSSDLKRFLEEELFLKVYVRSIDLPKAVIDLARVEAKHAV